MNIAFATEILIASSQVAPSEARTFRGKDWANHGALGLWLAKLTEIEPGQKFVHTRYETSILVLGKCRVDANRTTEELVKETGNNHAPHRVCQ